METAKPTGERIKEYLSENKRFDNREADEFREIKIETKVSKKAEGSARVKIGKTEVIVGVKLDVTTPYPDSPDKGNLMVTSELLPLSSSRFESGPPKYPAIEIGRLIDRAIRESKFIKLEELCIEKGEKVFSVFIDIYSINDDGNILDAAGIGALVALKNAKIPEYDKEAERIIYGKHTDKKIPVSKETPLVVTAHKIGKNIIVDPTQEEEDVSEAKITIGASEEGVIFSMQKGESKELTMEEMSKVLELTQNARKKVFSKIKKYFE